MHPYRTILTLGAWACGTSVLPPIARADIDPVSGIDFVTITHAGNAPWAGNGTPGDLAVGRGSVGYEYGIGTTEVPLSLWVDFYNAAMDRPAGDSIPHVQSPFWSAQSAAPNNSSNPAARRWTIPAGAEHRPVGGITWRTAAVLCNWLTANKATNREAFLSGAYDVSTFGYGPPGDIFTDQDAHTPGARYYIPTWDEWLKAAHWDPNRIEQDGWWTYSYMSDVQLPGGPPGTGNGNYGFSSPSPFAIPLGAYPNVQSPWGLLDTAGGTTEWTESTLAGPPGQPRYRFFDGSPWTGSGLRDAVFPVGADLPSFTTLSNGFRLAMTVPSPVTTAIPAALCLWHGVRRQRQVARLLAPALACSDARAGFRAVKGVSG
ncbi:MAG TPA: SUMF1/EgtB/PvdO family nonheme iron enzyme [Phycisphaerales bacterium]|nr:SUMF1/EgtB/PvdO family nonheme iron enzyme [Phycisphaerales bacterium]